MILERLPASLARTRFILASASPRRIELLRQIPGLPPIVVRPSSFAEDLPFASFDGAAAYARATAAAKADDVCAQMEAEGGEEGEEVLIVAADTVVESASGALLEKPADDAHAAAMLTSLAGTTHSVHTGVAIRVGRRDGGGGGAWRARAARDFAVTTRVAFAPLSVGEIEAYVRTGEPAGKAGAYGIQGAASAFVSGIEGCYFNVVGLPLHALAGALGDMVERGEVGVVS